MRESIHYLSYKISILSIKHICFQLYLVEYVLGIETHISCYLLAANTNLVIFLVSFQKLNMFQLLYPFCSPKIKANCSLFLSSETLSATFDVSAQITTEPNPQLGGKTSCPLELNF